MKIDLKFENLDRLIDDMGAKRVAWKDDKGLSELEIEQILSKEGLEVNWENLETKDDGQFIFLEVKCQVLFILKIVGMIFIRLKTVQKMDLDFT